MAIEIKVPVLPESVADATVAKWYKKAGEAVRLDEHLVDLETDKVMIEVPAPANGVLSSIDIPEGQTVKAGTLLGILTEGASAEPAAKTSAKAAKIEEGAKAEKPAKVEKPAKIEKAEAEKPSVAKTAEKEVEGGDLAADLSPAVRRMIAEHNLDIRQIKASGKGGRLTKEDVEKHLQASVAAPSAAETAAVSIGAERGEKRVPMSRLRAKIAERLVQSQHQAAMLTTFNEINMQPVMELRKTYQEKFEKTYQVRLGFMSFFVKAVVEALKRFPIVNASIDGSDIIYHNYFDIGIAIGGGPRGLVVPIVRNADLLSMADIEKTIHQFAEKVKNNKLTIEDMSGGTFTITNGGVYGSMLSTPIINPPQSAILGMHKIAERPVVEKGQIVIRPVMYVAMSYDHRIIDGTDSVKFLVTVKELLEDPARLLLQI
jgi:2-oxoglutarate dehydrogenase E2 component (dihydrolipoamide succinyltransferase)